MDKFKIINNDGYFTVGNQKGRRENHTHIKTKGTAKMLVKLMREQKIPKSQFLKLSAIRCTIDKKYQKKIKKSLRHQRKMEETKNKERAEKMDPNKLKIDYQSTDDLIPYVNNPRHNEEAVDQVAGSIKEFGFKNPIIVDKDNVIVAGHTRLLASRKLGLKEVPTIKAEDLTDQQVKAFRIADNRTAEFAEWDMDALALELEGLDHLYTGFDDEFLEDLKGEIDVEEDEYDVEEELAPSRVNPGEIWQLGNHRLMCADSTQKENVRKLMDGKQADLVVTDPPYNVDYEGQDGMKIDNDAMEDDTFVQFLTDAFAGMKEALKEGGAYYIFHADSNRYAFSKALLENDMKERQNLIWVKSSLVLGRQDYQWKHEPILYGWKDGAAHYFVDDFSQTTVIEDLPNINQMDKDELKDHIKLLRKVIDAGTTIVREDKPSNSKLHPTMKPVQLVAMPIKNNSRKGEIVLDQFGGAGSTLIAGEQLERTVYTMELDPRYADVIVDRWESFTGKEARKITN